MTHLQLFGVIIEHIGQELQKPDSKMTQHFQVSTTQFYALLKMTRILTSPSVQRLYIDEVAARYGKSTKTIQNWITLGILPKGRKRRGDTREFWYASELDDEEDNLVRMGYIKRRTATVVRLARRCLAFLCFKNCAE